MTLPSVAVVSRIRSRGRGAPRPGGVPVLVVMLTVTCPKKPGDRSQEPVEETLKRGRRRGLPPRGLWIIAACGEAGCVNGWKRFEAWFERAGRAAWMGYRCRRAGL